jgi:hypothetical protein
VPSEAGVGPGGWMISVIICLFLVAWRTVCDAVCVVKFSGLQPVVGCIQGQYCTDADWDDEQKEVGGGD